jgi:endoglucanase
MRRRGAWIAAALLLLLAGFPTPAARAQTMQGTVATADWQAYRQEFVDGGRVIDDANGNITHSEGQGYGLLLAYLAGDRAGFEEIWTFTQTELLIRDDGLAAWRWDPKTEPHITDVNNATDGDILIAYALGLAGKAWNQPRYTRAGSRIAEAIGAQAVRQVSGKTVLLPGATGFVRENGSTVLNPSYWIFEAFGTMAVLAPKVNWRGVVESGRWLIDSARFGKAQLPTDWVALEKAGQLAPAPGFDPLFGYNSLRIPLYLVRAGLVDSERLRFFQKLWVETYKGEPAIVDVGPDRIVEKLTDPGYRMLAASLACALDGTRLDGSLKIFKPTQYYPSTLHLLGLSILAEKFPQCL